MKKTNIKTLSDAIPGLKDIEKNGLIFTDIMSDQDGLHLEFIKYSSKNNCKITGCISLYYSDYAILPKDAIKTIKEELSGFYENGK